MDRAKLKTLQRNTTTDIWHSNFCVVFEEEAGRENLCRLCIVTRQSEMN